MLAGTLRTLYGYSRWANEQLFDTAAGLTPEQWLHPGSARHGSVRDTLVHLLGAQRGWLALCDGSKTAEQVFAEQLTEADYPDIAALRTLSRGIDAATGRYLSRLSDAEAASARGGVFPWSGGTFSQPVWAILMHVANHNTQHRSEAAAMMTEFGYSPGYVDLIGYTIGALAPSRAA